MPEDKGSLRGISITWGWDDEGNFWIKVTFGKKEKRNSADKSLTSKEIINLLSRAIEEAGK